MFLRTEFGHLRRASPPPAVPAQHAQEDLALVCGTIALQEGTAAAEGEWPEGRVRYVRRYHITDFSRWKDHDAYQAEFQKLLRDLKEPAKG